VHWVTTTDELFAGGCDRSASAVRNARTSGAHDLP